MSGLVVDLFAGGGGASVGLESALGRKVDVAINHDPTAIAVHRANHPSTRHFAEDVWKVDPREATRGRPVALLWASPDCTHFSIARGGKPNRSKKIRSLAWAVIRWAKAVRPKLILLENVREFQTWGPLDEDGRIIPHLKGHTFKTWVGTLRGLGYRVDWRILNAADFGAPTNRRRLFLVARCDGKPLLWPERTHGPGAVPHRAAAECIDWSMQCPSIFERKKTLAEKTLWRIANGIRRFVLENPRPFIVKSNHGRDLNRSAGVDQPLSTITAAARGHAVVSPLLGRVDMTRANSPLVHPPGEPLRTIHTGGGHALIAPTLAPMNADNPPMSAEKPLGVVTSQHNRFGLVAPSLVQIDQQGAGPGATSPPDSPVPTTTTENRHALCAAYLAKHFGGHEGQWTQLPLPLGTVTTKDHHAIAAACLAKFRGTSPDQPPSASVEEPLPVVTAGGIHVAEVRAFLLKYYGTSRVGKSLFDPSDTLTAKDRLGLVTVEGIDYQIVDIGMRMLEPHELLRAQFGDFADGYDLSPARTKSAKVRLIGNSVCPDVVRALVEANHRGAERKEMVA